MKFSMADYQLDGKVALITGAVYGIGFEIARGSRRQVQQLFSTVQGKHQLIKDCLHMKSQVLKHMAMSLM